MVAQGARSPASAEAAPPETEPAAGVLARRWPGELALGFARRGARTVLVHKRHRGPFMVQSPFYPGDGACHVYLLHPPGGLVGGDVLRLEVDAGPGTDTLLTTPAAGKFYRSDGRRTEQHQTIRIGEDARCEWVPQENLLFPGSRATTSTRFELAARARLLAWETWCLGRPARGEGWGPGELGQLLEVHVDGRPCLIERLRLRGDEPPLDAPWGHAGHAAWSVALAYPAGDEALESARAVCHGHRDALARSGATLLDGLLVARAQAGGTRALSGWLRDLWGRLRPALLGLEPRPPRIWAT